MNGIDIVFDGALALLLLALAVIAMHARGLYICVVVFIAFGLLLALTWSRLGAPDLALAEAAIGAGLTGVLMLSALAQIKSEQALTIPMRQKLPALFFVLLVFGILAQAIWILPEAPVTLALIAESQVEQSGVIQPVTAVLLNFRAWDTLLELLVLLLALMGARQLAPRQRIQLAPWPLLLAWSRLLAPLTVVVGGYLLWRGSHGPGGAFQAGAILAAGAVMLRLNQLLPPLSWRHWWVRVLVLIGLGTFFGIAVLTAWLGEGWLVYPAAWPLERVGALIVFIEVMATLSIAVTLTLLVAGEKDEVQG